MGTVLPNVQPKELCLNSGNERTPCEATKTTPLLLMPPRPCVIIETEPKKVKELLIGNQRKPFGETSPSFHAQP